MPYKTSLIKRFESSISHVNELLAVHRYLQTAPTTQIADHLLRAALTMLVSAIDTSIHELIISAIMYELKEDKSKFKIDGFNIAVFIAKEPVLNERLRLIEAELRRQFAKETYQSSRQIESTLASIGINKIWTKLSTTSGQSPEDIKTRLDLLVRRRNQIVHEGDLDHLHNLHEIRRKDLDDSLLFAKEIINGIIFEYQNIIEST